MHAPYICWQLYYFTDYRLDFIILLYYIFYLQNTVYRLDCKSWIVWNYQRSDNLMYYQTITSLAGRNRSHPTLVFWTCIHPYANRWQAAIAVQSFQQSRTSDDTNVTDVINSWTKNNNTVKYCAYGTTNNNPSPGKGEGPTWSHLHVLWLICSHMHSTLLYYFRLTIDLSWGTWHTS